MKFAQVIEYNKKYFSSKNHAEYEAGRLVPDLLLFKKALYKVKAGICSLVSTCSDSLQLGIP